MRSQWSRMRDTGLTRRERWAIGVMLASDVLVLTLWMTGVVTGLFMMALNASVAAVVFGVAGKSDMKIFLAGLAVVLGPLAATVLLILLVQPMRGVGAAQATAAADDLPPMSRAEAICAALADGRRFSPRKAAPPSFAGLFVADDLIAQQRALMIMARAFDPVLRPALHAALASPLPAVRVQAAAVFAYLRDSYAAQARDVLAGRHGLDAVALAAQVHRLRRSGFMDAQTGTLLAEVLPAQVKGTGRESIVSTGKVAVSRPDFEAPPSIKRYSCGGIA